MPGNRSTGIRLAARGVPGQCQGDRGTAQPSPPREGWLPGPGWVGMGYSNRHFIVMMIPHHEGAIAMADLTLTRACQTKENAQMRSWHRQR